MSAIPTSVPASSPKPAPASVPAPPKKPHAWIGLLAAIVVVAGATFAYRALTKPAQPVIPVAAIKTAKAFVGPLEVTLRVSGQTSARNFANVIAPLLRGVENRGSLALLDLAASGSVVKKGALLARIDAQATQDHIDDLKDTISQAANDIQKREAEQKVEWEDMQQTLRVAKGQYDKAKLDYSAAEVKVDVERELLKLSMDEAEARYKQQQGDIAFRKASQESEIKILKLTLERHKRHMGRHQHDLEKYTIRSPMDGLVVMASIFRGGEMGQIQQGDQVYPGQQILKVVDTRNMQVEGSVSQADSGELRVSQSARIGLDAFPDVHLTGKVYSIGALAVGGWRQNYYIRAVPVRVQIEGSDPRLIPDLSAHADIVLETVPDQLQVPAGAIQEENGRTYVSVRQAGGFVRREVKTGKHSNVSVAVLAGLKPGEEVRLP
jgi:multidrug efflux pump subunit AcrA (membrane-fusion protein)